MIQRAVAIAQSAELRPEDLPEEVVAPHAAPAAPEGTVAAARERADKETIAATLARHGGEIGAAARELQVSRTTMWRLMKKSGSPSDPASRPGASMFQKRNTPMFRR